MTTRPDKIIYVDMLDAEVGIFTDRENLKTWFLDRELTDQAETTADEANNGLAFHVENPKGGPYFVIYLQKDTSIFTVSHEALHIAWFLLEFKGIDINADNHEALAYLQAYIARQASLFLGLIREVE